MCVPHSLPDTALSEATVGDRARVDGAMLDVITIVDGLLPGPGLGGNGGIWCAAPGDDENYVYAIAL